MNILLIEDNETLAKMMSKYFRIKKLDCTVVNNGKEGLEKILEKKHDIVLLDLAMPDFSGYDIIESLEKKGEIKQLKIIVLTASSISNHDLDDLVKKGVKAYLRKPVDLEKLYKTIRSSI